MSFRRDESVDILRGIAVVLMIAAHSIFLRFGLANFWLNEMLNFANTFCYTTFLLAFGVGSYYSLVLGWKKGSGQKAIRRMVQLLLMYYGAAVAWAIGNAGVPIENYPELGRVIVAILKWQYFPGFTEYLPSFLLFTLIVLAGGRGLRVAKDSQRYMKVMLLLMVGGLALHGVAGYLSYQLTAPSPVVRQLIGSRTTFDFPVLQYLPVLVLGMMLGPVVAEGGRASNYRLLWLAYGLMIGEKVLVYSFHLTHRLGWDYMYLNELVRWPPSLLFIVNSLKWALFVFVLIRVLIDRMGRGAIALRPLTYLGKRAMGLLVYHLLVLFSLQALKIPAFGQAFEVAMFVVALFGTYWLLERGWQTAKSRIY